MTQVDRFLTLINQRYFNNSDTKRIELGVLWKSFEKDNTVLCSFILTRGKNKGNTCGRKSYNGKEMCKAHTKN